ncbi:MAG TPA: hypothetical protein PKD99_05335 [Sphingopyxis sp.]|nr:hypothetical protein [Sphingopyxis sp.]HMP44510.1 hypothetical protein [Sphingopyxis sp.]HMQ18175.1 hypothetical protein [Sphingopyxis sp.]
MIRPLAAAALISLLGACAATPPPRSATPPPVTGPAAPPAVVRPVQHNDLIGQSPAAVGRLFGQPRIDVTEGGARKLQFQGSACVLDIYFYAPRAGADPVATHVDARTPDGRNAEVNSCADALRR